MAKEISSTARKNLLDRLNIKKTGSSPSNEEKDVVVDTKKRSRDRKIVNRGFYNRGRCK